ncbi:MAG: hypothetical protein ABIC95_02145 [archaeon]
MWKAFLLFAVLLLFASAVTADLGPKPSMSFNLVYETSYPVELVSGVQHECADESCADMHPLESMGPQDFSCHDSYCSSMAYGYAPYHRLELRFSDKTRWSEVFPTGQFSADYKVRVTDERLIVDELSQAASRLPFFIFALMVTLFLELIVAFAFLYNMKPRKRVLLTVAGVNCVTLPLLWFLLPDERFALLFIPLLIIFEILIGLFEWLALYVVNKKQLTVLRTFLMSLAMNATSFFLGGFLLLVAFVMVDIIRG